VSELQERALDLLRKRSRSLTELACAMRINRLATSSVLRALERKGLVMYGPPLGNVDQWSRGDWYATQTEGEGR
jgi:hypothetical protein